jgi:uncharacterized Zn finger protein (UPF0148 family)
MEGIKMTPEERKKREDNASGRMGELLLKGWTMLGSSCEECYVPLMRNKQMDEICVVCERNYRKDLQKKVETLAPIA